MSVGPPTKETSLVVNRPEPQGPAAGAMQAPKQCCATEPTPTGRPGRAPLPDTLVTPTPQKRPPTLIAIIVYKLVKGSLFLSLAMMAYALSDNDLSQEYQNLMEFLRIHPDNRFFAGLALKVGLLTESKVLWLAVGTFVFSLFSLVEGVGLVFRVSWAGWLAIGESSFFIPIEVVELSRRVTPGMAIILITNVVIVWYLYANRHRLFIHH
jgi:uncharacterized membrane protein (DUF2068 family)